jgi:hypothetical protein
VLLGMSQELLDTMVKRYNNGELDILEKARAKFNITNDQIDYFRKACKIQDK